MSFHKGFIVLHVPSLFHFLSLASGAQMILVITVNHNFMRGCDVMVVNKFYLIAFV